MKNKKSLFIAMLLLAVGFATVATTLYLNGTVGIESNQGDFDIIFTDAIASENNLTFSKLVKNADAVIESDQKSITFTTQDLAAVGEWAQVNYEISNYSTDYDAEVSVQVELVDPTQQDLVDEYLSITTKENWDDDSVIEAGTRDTGWVRVSIKKAYLGESETTDPKEIEFKVTYTANAKEIDVKADKLPEKLYSFSGILKKIENDGTESLVTNGNLVFFSEHQDVVIRNDGTFNVKGLEAGTHEVYYMGNVDASSMTKEQVIANALCNLNVDINVSKKEELICKGTDRYVLDGLKTAGEIKIDVISGTGQNVGDEIAIGNEHFYIIRNDNGTMDIFAKYNLNVGNMCDDDRNCTPIENQTGIQDINMTGLKIDRDSNYLGNGSTAYGESSNYSGSFVEQYVNNYVNYLNSKNNGLNATGRLISKKEIELLVSDGKEMGYSYIKTDADAKGFSWIYSTSYWTSTPNNDYVYFIENEGGLRSVPYNYDFYFGVRPVITIQV